METYAGKEDLLDPLVAVSRIARKDVQIICGIFEEGKIVGGFHGEDEWFWGLVEAGNIVGVKIG